MLITQVAQRIKEATSVVVLTGAGVSAESGVATFRDADGLWAKFSPQELASMDGFLANPQRVRDWYDYRRAIIASVKPNAGHHALAYMQQRVKNFTLITQNVDRLHQQAGSVDVLEVHGNIIENRCLDCSTISATSSYTECPSCGGMMRPNVVWFGENLPEDVWMAAEKATMLADVFLSIGTSSEVYPAAGLISLARSRGAYVVEINPNTTSLSHAVTVHLKGPSGEILPQITKEMES